MLLLDFFCFLYWYKASALNWCVSRLNIKLEYWVGVCVYQECRKRSMVERQMCTHMQGQMWGSRPCGASKATRMLTDASNVTLRHTGYTLEVQYVCITTHTPTHTSHTLVVALPAPFWGVWGCNTALSPVLPRPSPSLLCRPHLGTPLQVVPRVGHPRASSAIQRTRLRPQHLGYRCLWRD